MILKYHKNFWKFYKANQKEVEYILRSILYKYQDSEDLHSELLIALAESSFLKDFDPSMAHLNTYFTLKARGIASHIARKWRTRAQRFQSVSSIVINEDVNDGDIFEVLDVHQDNNVFETLIAKDLVSKLSLKMRKTIREIFLRRLKGATLKQIAEEYGVTIVAIHKNMKTIKDIILRFYHSEATELTGAVGIKS